YPCPHPPHELIPSCHAPALSGRVVPETSPMPHPARPRQGPKAKGPAQHRRQAGPTARPRRGPWKRAQLPVIGLTGTIGAGKSRVATELAGLGAFVLDADQVGHALLDQRPARAEVVARFGPSVLDSDQPDRVDRAALGRIVFADPQALRDLEAIVHP